MPKYTIYPSSVIAEADQQVTANSTLMHVYIIINYKNLRSLNFYFIWLMLMDYYFIMD